MSYADKVFIDMCKDILENGVSTEGEKVRPHWEDGTPAYTIKKFGVVNRYDLSKEFPLVTLRKQRLRVQQTNCYGYGRKNPTISMTFTAIYGMHGRTRTAQSAKHTVISLV